MQLGAIRELNDRGWGVPPQALLHAADTAENSAFKEFLRSIDGESRRLPRGNDPDADREYAYGPAQGLPDTKVGTFTQELYDEAVNGGWLVISMKKDWKRIFAEGTAN